MHPPSRQSGSYRLGYLSASPRVTTHPNTQLTGPRAHVVGVINGFESLGWRVRSFIVGNWLRAISQLISSEQSSEKNNPRQKWFKSLVVDLARLCLGPLSALLAWVQLYRRVDVVYERLTTLQSLGWIFRLTGTPWVLESNAVLYQEAHQVRDALLFFRVARWLELWAYRACNLVICTSQPLKEMIVEVSDVPADKVQVVDNAVDITRFDPTQVQDPPRLLGDTFTVGFVGSLYAWQGIDLLIQAIQRLRQAGLDIGAVVVGEGQMYTDWQAASRAHGVAEHVIFTGQVAWDDVPAYIAGFDVGYSGQMALGEVQPYFSPMKVYEYMAMARPVVSADIDAVRDLVINDQTGYRFVTGDLNDLTAMLQRAYQNREQLPRMGQQARQMIVENHTWTQRVQTLIGLIQARDLL